jgi:large subunit ribosomal protein L2
VTYGNRFFTKNFKLQNEGKKERQGVLIDSFFRTVVLNLTNIKGKKKSGRNKAGKLIISHSGGGIKERIRFIDLTRRLSSQYGQVFSKHYDSTRSANLALIVYNSGIFGYIICPDGLKIGDFVFACEELNDKFSIGCSTFLENFRIGSRVHMVERLPFFGGQLARSAGAFVEIKRKIIRDGNKFVCLKLPSKKLIFVSGRCFGTLGRVGNIYHKFYKYSTAGRVRLCGKRPSVRGVAMNPVDHPHGGGEGKSSGGRISVSRWGRLTKGFKTQNLKHKRKIIRIFNRFKNK